MAQSTTPKGSKRTRTADGKSEEQTPVSAVKRRRLDQPDDSSPSTPKVLRAAASALSGALPGRRRSTTTVLQPEKEDPDSAYEVPDSGDERRQAKAKKPLSHRKTVPSRPAKEANGSLYDVPDSGDELAADTSDSQRKRAASSVTKPRASLNGRSTPKSLSRRSAAAPSTANKAAQVDTSDTGVASEVETAVEESPSKSRSIRKSKAQSRVADKVDNGMPDNERESSKENERPGEATPAVTPSGRKRRRNALDNLVIDGTPKLKGILTPSRRGRQAGDTPRKSVAFDGDGPKEFQEVFFADLPGKDASASKTPRGKAAPKIIPVQSAKAEEAKKDERQGAEEGEDEDDEVCAICSKPDSAPPNEIIFCDNCDMAVHQLCYDLPVVPEGDWLCKNCTQEEVSQTKPKAAIDSLTAGSDKAPDIPNFEQHLRSWQRVLLDRCTGRRRIKLRDQDEAYQKTFQLVEQTVVAGEGNSMLVIGARGCGKTTLVETVISNLSAQHKEEFHVVRLNGFTHTDDKLALKEIWRQLGKEMEVEDDVINRTNNYADTLASLLALLSHPSEISGAQAGVTSKSVVFLIDEFDLFATHARQTLLYNLFDIAQARKAPIAVLGLTTRIDVVESLEKRVKSRFSHRYVYLGLPRSLPAYWDICRQGLVIEDQEVEAEGIDAQLEGHAAFRDWWTGKVEELRKEPSFQDHLELHFYSSKSVPAFLTTCVLPLASLSAAAPSLRIPGFGPSTTGVPGCCSLEPPDSKLHLLESLSELELALLVAATRLDIVAHTDTVNFAMAYDEYASLMGRQRVQSASAGMLAAVAAGGARVWGRGAAGRAWERLASLGLLIPAGLAGRRAGAAAAAGGGYGGLEAKMWKTDVALEEIPCAVRLNAVLARWCKEI